MPNVATTHRDLPLLGAYCTIEGLTAARFQAAELNLSPRRHALSQLAGVSRSPLRGRGLDFEEVRAYQAGDDVRTIDWRVTARSGRPYTKLFREERERPLLIFVDQRQPMFFGSTHCFKSHLAVHLGALLAWAGLARGDRVGGLVAGNDSRNDLRPRHNRRALMHWLSTLHDYNRRLQRDTRLQHAGDSLGAAFTDLRRTARPGSALFLISDFSGFEAPGVLQPLQDLARHCDLNALIIGDPLERELPPPGRYSVSDGIRRLTLDSADAALRQRHREQFSARRKALRAALGTMAIASLEIDTSQAPLRALAPLFGARQ